MNSVIEGDVITLDNNEEYICCSRVVDNKDTYLCLVSNFKPVKFRFAKEIIEDDEISLEIIYDQKEKEYVFELFKDIILK